MDFEAIKKAAQGYEADMTKFLRDLIAIPSESCEEEGVIKRTILEMERLGFDRAEIDPEGNALGWMGDGEKIIAFDGHIDTVGIGNIDNWEQDPYKGYETEDVIYGRGGSDQEGGVVSAVYGAKIMKDLGLIPEGYKILVTATVQEEDCDGLCWQYIHNEDGITPEFVVSTEPTDGGIYRGHRGRMEIRVDVKGVSCHGSAPERGDNAIYKMADIVQEIRALNENDDAETTEIKGLVKMLNPQFNPEHYEDARFLGRGTCTVSQIFYTSPSRCAVADSCAVSIDRRMTAGDRPVVAATAHFGAWELLAGLFGDFPAEYPHVVVVRRSKNVALNDFTNRMRGSRGAVILGHRDAAFSILRALKRNGVTAFLVDHNTNRNEAVFLPFLGRAAAVNKGPALLAVRAEALVFAVFLRRDGEDYVFHIEELADTAMLDGGHEANMRTVARAYTEAVERMVRLAPEQWFWMHNRWKTRPGPDDAVPDAAPGAEAGAAARK